MQQIRETKMKSKLFFGLIALGISSIALAQSQSATLGQPSQIRFAIPNVTNQDKCHIEVSLPNQQKIALDVDGPQFNAEINFTPDQIGSTTLKWEGKRKNRGFNSVNACPGSGVIQISVKGNTEFIAQQWNLYFARVPEHIGDCVKVGMDVSQLKYQVLADPNALLTGPEDQKVKPIYEKCEAFAKQNQPRKGVPCTLASQNNLRTTCDGFYAERQPDGRLKTISRTEAIQLQFEGKPWTIGVSENLDTRAARLKQEEEDKAKQAATIAAQREAEEKERKFRESPEYKKQQAEIERKRIADEKEAAIAAKKAQEEAERQKVANARAEQERIQKEEAALKAQRAQEEKKRLEYAKEFPFYAVITCGNNFPVHACFSGDVRTEIELRNGNAYKMYTLVDIMQIRPNQQRGITFDLRNNFELKMQNSQDSLILNLKVYNRATQQIVYEKSAARFGVIRISN